MPWVLEKKVINIIITKMCTLYSERVGYVIGENLLFIKMAEKKNI